MHIGIIGTGYAAKARAAAIRTDGRATLRWVAGREDASMLAQEWGVDSYYDGLAALTDPLVDLVFICVANIAHGALVREALLHHKHVVVEYPLALDYEESLALAHLAQQKQRLLHVEHIELISDLHLQLREHVANIGPIFHARSVTQTPTHPAPQRWSYHRDMFGFPLIGALSRISRLIDLLGDVKSVSCQNNYIGEENGYFQSCFCAAQLHFSQGSIAEVLYAKGAQVWRSEISLELQGAHGGLQLQGDEITVFGQGDPIQLSAGSRRGLFQRDTTAVLDHLLLLEKPLYTSLDQSLYALQVAAACQTSATTGQVVTLLP
jgi:biliverdin reductase